MLSVGLLNFPRDKIYVLLNEDYRKNFFRKSIKKLSCKNYFELSQWINSSFRTKFNGGDVKYWIKGERLDERTGRIHPKFMPLWLVLKLLELNDESVEVLQRNIISYRSSGSGLIVNNPMLPIKVTPELDSVVIHLFGDGAAGDFTPSYTQKNRDSFNNFIKKLENCFGGFQRSIYFTQGKHQIKFPKAITDVISSYYLIKSYRTYDSEIPEAILNRKDKEHKLACIISFIVDEAQVRDVILLYSANNRLLFHMRKLVLDCDYRCSKIKFNEKANSYWFGLSNKDIEKFSQDLQELSKKFPTCNLSFKDDNLKFIIKRRARKNPKNRKITEKVILSALKRDRLNATQISRLTGYAHCTIVHNLKRLYDNNLLKRQRMQDGSYLWEISGFLGKKEEE